MTKPSNIEPNPSREELRQWLARVHAELGAAQRIEERSRQRLREVLTDIERLLSDRPTAARGTHGSPMTAAPHRLQALAIEFEAQHPLLAGSLRQFVDLLGRAGL